MMHRCLAGRALSIALLAPAAGYAQTRQPPAPRPPVGTPGAGVTRARAWFVSRADSVFVFVVDAPARRGGFVVSRRRVGDTTTVETPQPIRAEAEPAAAVARIGNELPLVMRAVAANDETELMRRLTSDAFMGTVASALWRNVAFALGRLWVDARVQPGAEYEYRVTWLREDGSADPRRPAITQRVRATETPLPPPTTVAARAGDGRATLTWAYPRYTGDVLDHAIAFTVWRADLASGPFRRVSATPLIRNDAAARLTFADSGLRAGARYRYHVRAMDIAGREGPPSTEVAVVPADHTPPAAPIALQGTAGDGRVALSWRLGTDADLAGWQVERTLDLGKKWTRLTTRALALGQPSFVDSTVAGPWQHFYRVIAVDSAGNESVPSAPVDVSPLDQTPPQAPSGLTAAVVQHRLALKWQPSPSRDVIGYYVYRADDSTRLVRLTSRPIARPQFTDSGYTSKGLAPGMSYAVAVSAVDRAYNESARVHATVAVPDDQPPEPPTGVAPTNVRGRRVDVSWTSSPSRDVATYEVTRSAPGDSARRLARVSSSGQLLVRDTAVVHGRIYTYRVIAIDGAGNRSPAATDTLTFVDFEPPSPTRHVDAALDAGTGVTLTWEPVIDAELAGYHVYRGTLPTSATERLTAAPVRDRRFVDHAGNANHWYVVRAIDRSGNESRASEPVRPIVRATTPTRSAPTPQTTPTRTRRTP